MKVITKMVDDFNAKQDQYEVSIEAFPQASYNDSVAAASVAGSLPCIIDLDQPTVPNFAWSGYVQELPVPADMLAKFTAGGVGLYKDKPYSLGQFDVALLNYARKSVLEKYNIRIPTLDEPWTLDEFNAALKTLKELGRVRLRHRCQRPIHRRMVVLCLFTHAAELRRRSDRPQHFHDGRGRAQWA